MQPQSLAATEGTSLWFLGTLLLVKATSETTKGAFGLFEQLAPASFATPYHVHHAEDEAFYILEGEVTYIFDGVHKTVGPGAYVFAPRDVPHGYRVSDSGPARLLFMNTPAGAERFFIELSEPAASLTLPPPTAPDIPKLIALASTFKMDILGPLPGF